MSSGNVSALCREQDSPTRGAAVLLIAGGGRRISAIKGKGVW